MGTRVRGEAPEERSRGSATAERTAAGGTQGTPDAHR